MIVDRRCGGGADRARAAGALAQAIASNRLDAIVHRMHRSGEDGRADDSHATDHELLDRNTAGAESDSKTVNGLQ
eukprot:SAG31_NODE_34525_length_332_cov_0.669528_1_plen_74_part_10